VFCSKEVPMRRTVFPMVLALTLVLLTAGCTACCDESECRDEYGLIKSSECIEIPPGPPGPVIEIEPSSGGGGSNSIVFVVDGAVSGSSEPILDPTNFPGSYCKLRDDFIGLKANYLKIDTAGSTVGAKEIQIESNGLLLEIKKTSLGTLMWKITDKSTNPATTCTLEPSGVVPANADVPPEFLSFTTSDTMKELTLPVNHVDRVEFQVQMP